MINNITFVFGSIVTIASVFLIGYRKKLAPHMNGLYISLVEKQIFLLGIIGIILGGYIIYKAII